MHTEPNIFIYVILIIMLLVLEELHQQYMFYLSS